jgi:hypothetical protein
MKAVAKKKQSRASICRRYKITAATLAGWELEGIDIFSDQQMQERNSRKHGGTNSAEMTAAKLRKLRAEARTAEMRADQQDGKLISLEELTICLTKIGSVLKAQLSKLRGELPPMLYGMSEAEISRRIGEATDRTLNDICDELQEIKAEPPRPE